MSGQPLLELKGVFKRFGAVTALAGVDFHVSSGEVMALVGDNGAGKSTMIKTIAGIHPKDEGEILWEGNSVSINGPKDSAALGIEVVYQDLALCDNLDVVANLFLGQEEPARGPIGRALAAFGARLGRLLAPVARLLTRIPGAGAVGRLIASGWRLLRRPFNRLDETRMEHRSQELLDNVAVTIPSLRSEVGTLSGGQRQQVAVARSLLGDPKVVLLDEPTAALGVEQTALVLALINRLREQGLGVVVISHNLADVFEVADRIFVLRLGQRAGSFAAADTTEEHVVSAITGADQAQHGTAEDAT